MPLEAFVGSVKADKKLSDGALVRVCDVDVIEDVVLSGPAIARRQTVFVSKKSEKDLRKGGRDLLVDGKDDEAAVKNLNFRAQGSRRPRYSIRSYSAQLESPAAKPRTHMLLKFIVQR
jgi:hypothetical protein